MSKNIMLASINENSIRNLSTFTMLNSKLAVLQARYNEIMKACKISLARMESEAKVVSERIITRGKNKGKKVYEYSYGTIGARNVPDEIYNSKCRRLEITKPVDMRSYMLRVEAQYKNACKDARKAYNEAIMALVPEGAYNAYIYGLNTGSYRHNDKHEFSFADYVAKTCKAMGFLGGDDSKAVDKFTESILVYFGASFRRGKVENGKVSTEACIRATSESNFNQLFISAIIKRLQDKAILKLTGKGYIKLSPDEAKAVLTSKTA